MGTRLVVYGFWRTPVGLTPPARGCVLRIRLVARSGRQVAEFVLLRPGSAEVVNVQFARPAGASAANGWMGFDIDIRPAPATPSRAPERA